VRATMRHAPGARHDRAVVQSKNVGSSCCGTRT
jgi:hypothetical protein